MKILSIIFVLAIEGCVLALNQYKHMYIPYKRNAISKCVLIITTFITIFAWLLSIGYSVYVYILNIA